MQSAQQVGIWSSEYTDASVFTSLSARFEKIGAQDSEDQSSPGDKGRTQLKEEEMQLFEDLLKKMLRYKPENKIKMGEVLCNSWFAYDE
jgi:serine/threonine-protein kinase SRPK3